MVLGVVVVLGQGFGSKRYFYACGVLLVVGRWLALVVALGSNGIGAQNDLGMLRCITSFFLGVLTVKAVSQVPRNLGPVLQSAIQLSALVAGVIIVSLNEAYPPISFLAPFAFAVFLVSLMAFPDAPRLPRVLVTAPLVWLGRRCYPVSLVHALWCFLTDCSFRPS